MTKKLISYKYKNKKLLTEYLILGSVVRFAPDFRVTSPFALMLKSRISSLPPMIEYSSSLNGLCEKITLFHVVLCKYIGKMYHVAFHIFASLIPVNKK